MLIKIYSIRYIFQKALAMGKMHAPVCVIKWKPVSVCVDMLSWVADISGRQTSDRACWSSRGREGEQRVGGDVFFTLFFYTVYKRYF